MEFPIEVKTANGTVITLKSPTEYSRVANGKAKDHVALFWGARDGNRVLLNTVLPGYRLTFAVPVAEGEVQLYTTTSGIVEINGQVVESGTEYDGEEDEDENEENEEEGH